MNPGPRWAAHPTRQAQLDGVEDGGQVQGQHRDTARAAHVLRSPRRTRHGRKPLVARFGGIPLRRQKTAVLTRPPTGPGHHPPQRTGHPAPRGHGARSASNTDNVQVHHVRKLADLDKPGQPQPPWAQAMAKRRRKTLVVCAPCHDHIHAGQPPRHAHGIVTGEPDARKSARPVRREAARKRTCPADTSPAADPSGWLLRYRRLVRDYERRPEHHEAMVLWATVTIMTRQLDRKNSATPPHPRWGRPRTAAPAPELQDRQAA